jgi:hypothetical protein
MGAMLITLALAGTGSEDATETTLRGHVRDSRDQHAIPALVFACDANYKGHCKILASAQANSDGQFSFQVPSHSLIGARLEVSAMDFVTRTISGPALRQAAEKRSDLTIDLTATAKLLISPAVREGKPVSAFRVLMQAHDQGELIVWEQCSVTGSTSGRDEMTRCVDAPAPDKIIVASPPGVVDVLAIEASAPHRLARAKLLLKPGDVRKVELSFDSPVHGLRVRVNDSDGHPLALTKIDISRIGSPPDAELEHHLLRQGPPAELQSAPILDDAGGTLVPILTPGRFAIGIYRLTSTGMTRTDEGSIDVMDVKPTGGEDARTIVLPGKAIRCTLLPHKGSGPLAITDLGLVAFTKGDDHGAPAYAYIPGGTFGSEVYFLWPEGADLLRVALSSADANAQTTLTSPQDRCDVRIWGRRPPRKH